MDQKYSFDLTTGSNDEGRGTFQAENLGRKRLEGGVMTGRGLRRQTPSRECF
jgi:hypothetical protein